MYSDVTGLVSLTLKKNEAPIHVELGPIDQLQSSGVLNAGKSVE